MSGISERILKKIEEEKISYGELSKLTGLSKSVLQRYATGETKKIPVEALKKIAEALHTTAGFLMGWEDEPIYAPNIIPMPKMNRIPILGAIACGEPILAAENIEGEVDIPDSIHADFALRCKGDSMINARIHDGDIVYIKQQPTVHNGEIAAVLVDDEATLKRVYLSPGTVILQPANPNYEPMVYTGAQLDEIRILGKAVGFTSTDI